MNEMRACLKVGVGFLFAAWALVLIGVPAVISSAVFGASAGMNLAVLIKEFEKRKNAKPV